jgi:hypothetical protein
MAPPHGTAQDRHLTFGAGFSLVKARDAPTAAARRRTQLGPRSKSDLHAEGDGRPLVSLATAGQRHRAGNRVERSGGPKRSRRVRPATSCWSPSWPGPGACANRRAGARREPAVTITEPLHAVLTRRSRACPATVDPGTVVGPSHRAAAHPPGPLPARLPPAAHPRPGHLQQAHPDPHPWLRLPPYRRCHLLSDHPAPPRQVDHPRRRRTAPGWRCVALPAAVRPGTGAPGRGGVHHQSALRRPGRRPQPGGPSQARAATLHCHRGTRHPAGHRGSPGQPS